MQGEIVGKTERTRILSTLTLVKGSCIDQNADAIVNAANRYLFEGSGVCGAIFAKAGRTALTQACNKHKTPLKDGEAVATGAYGITNAKIIIHAVGPNFGLTHHAFWELFQAYYNSLVVLKENNLRSIAFPLISSGIFGGDLENPVAESAKQCQRAFKKFKEDFPDYDVDAALCAFTDEEYGEAEKVWGEK